MKTTITTTRAMLFALCLAALGTLGACSHDDNDISNPTPGIALTPGLIPGAWTDGNTAGTRADQSTGITFAPGGEIVVWMYAKGGDAAYAQRNTFEINAEGKMQRKAYVPGSSDNEADLNVPAAGDYLFIVSGYAQCLLAGATDSDAKLPMKAWLCTAGTGGEDNYVFTVAANGNVSIACALSTAGIKLQMLTPDGSAYTQGDIVATPAAALKDLKGDVIASVNIGATGLAAWGDIEATTIAPGTEVMRLVVGGTTTYKVLAPASLNLIAGRLITLKVRVGATGITVEMKNSDGTVTNFVAEAVTDAVAKEIPAGYDRIIGSPEALAQFAKDVISYGFNGSNAYQTVDLDMNLLKPAADAGINPLTNNPYDYTATADNWVPIGTDEYADNNAYKGKYNGNGHTISNVKIVAAANGYFQAVGFFGALEEATLTGIHLRNISITDQETSDIASCGALAGKLTEGCTISNCSATGTIALDCVSELGGLIGEAVLSNNRQQNYITRCRASVDVSTKKDRVSELYIGGFMGYSGGAQIAGCSSNSTITWGDGTTVSGAGGFVGQCTTKDNSLIGCYSGGSIKTGGFGFCGALNSNKSLTAIGCYSDVSGAGNFINTANFDGSIHRFSHCAYTNADDSNIQGLAGSTIAANVYGILTASNATLADVMTLHWSVADGYTLTEVTKTWSTQGIWQDNTGALPTINLAYEGE